MVTAANAIDSLVNVATARPELVGKILGPLTRIGDIKRNEDCSVVLTAKVAKQLALLVGKVDARQQKQMVYCAKSHK